MTLIEEAKTELILVSPYVKMDNWGKMKSCLERAIERGVIITLIARKNADQDLSYIKSLNLKLVLVNDLHAKVYINDNKAIVTSQNLLHSSDINSVEIGYISQTQYERRELIDFVNQFIVKITPVEKKTYNSFSKTEETIKSIAIERVEGVINYDNKKHLKEWQLDKLYESFTSYYRVPHFKQTATYVFSDELFNFADLILDSHYVIKIEKRLNGSDSFLEKILNINFNLKQDYKIIVLTSHKTHFYIEFIPLNNIIINYLIEDYLNVTNNILKEIKHIN